MMNVTSSVPSTALEKISRKIYRPRSRSTGAALPRHVRRGDYRQLGQFLFGRMQFEIIDENRRGYHADLRREAGAADERERRGVVHIFECRGIVACGQNVLERAHVEAAE